MNGWRRGRYVMAITKGPDLGTQEVDGWAKGGLFMHRAGYKHWMLSHTNTGHRIASFDMTQAEAFAEADRVLALTDWTFSTLDGWKNACPDLPDILDAMGIPRASKSTSAPQNADIARAVLEMQP